MKIKLLDVERGLGNAIKTCHALSRNWHDQVRLAKISKRFERTFDPYLEAFQGIVRQYGHQDKGAFGVNPNLLDEKRLEEWKAKSKEWRETEVDFEFEHGKPDEPLSIKLGNESLIAIPHNLLEAMVDYVELSEDASQTKEQDLLSQLEKLKGEVEKLQKKDK